MQSTIQHNNHKQLTDDRLLDFLFLHKQVCIMNSDRTTTLTAWTIPIKKHALLCPCNEWTIPRISKMSRIHLHCTYICTS